MVPDPLRFQIIADEGLVVASIVCIGLSSPEFGDVFLDAFGMILDYFGYDYCYMYSLNVG